MNYPRFMDERPGGLTKAGNLTAVLMMIVALGSALIGVAQAEATDYAQHLPNGIADFGKRHQSLPNLPGIPSKSQNAAEVTYLSRGDEYNDFLRILWVPPGATVTTLTLGKRAFFTASIFLKPPPTVDELVNFVGNEYQVQRDFVVMRCRPTAEQRQIVEPILATWPNVLPAIASDLCSSSDPAEQYLCGVAAQYHDEAFDIYAVGLREALEVGSQLYATPASIQALISNYGIYPAFTGLGFTVWDSSAGGATVPMLTAGILRHSVVPEYLLKNATLEEANCRCVQVPESERLHTERVDPAVVWSRGKLTNEGACRVQNSLEF